jgi:hypothetical protein
MSQDAGPSKTLVVVAVVGVGLLCGLGGLLTGGFFFYGAAREAEMQQAVEAERAAAEQEREARRAEWLASLPVDERAAIEIFDRAERAAVDLVAAIVAGERTGPDEGLALALRSIAGGTPPVSVTSPRAETTDSAEGRTESVLVDVVLKWERAAPTLVRVTLDHGADGSLTASAIEIADADSE